MTPTPEQVDIISAATRSKSSLMVHALAGCAKTTTIVEAAKLMRPTSALALSFGTKITEELRARLPDWIEVKTLNSLGNSAWGSALGKRCEVNKTKLTELMRPYSLEEADWFLVRELVTNARHRGIVPQGAPGFALLPDTAESWESLVDAVVPERLIKTAREILRACVAESYSGVIDYDDQIYMSALYGGVFKKYKLVIADEAQDLSILNHRMLGRMAEDRIIAVGDEHQSIFAFRGADHNSMRNLRKLRTEWLDFPLSVTFRCPRAVVERRRHYTPGLQAAEGNADGEVIVRRGPWYWAEVPKSGSIAILCRNNAPLIDMSFKLLRLNVPFHMAGRDTARPLKSLVKRILPETGTVEKFCEIVDTWAEADSALANGKENKVDGIQDRAASIRAIITANNCTRRVEIFAMIDVIFAKDGVVELSTVHRAKGLEWDTVLHIDPWRLPSRWAKTPEDFIQENNVLNVLETRTKHTLMLVNVDEFAGA